MRLVFTKHARDRMFIRLISKDWVAGAIAHPDKFIELDAERKQVIKRLNGDKISVVYTIENDKIIVITVFWGE